MKTRTTEVTPVYVEAICAECGQILEREYLYYVCRSEDCTRNGEKVYSFEGYPRIDFITKDGRVVG